MQLNWPTGPALATDHEGGTDLEISFTSLKLSKDRGDNHETEYKSTSRTSNKLQNYLLNGRADTSYTIEALTESEAKAILRFKSLDRLRARLVEAESKRSQGGNSQKISAREVLTEIDLTTDIEKAISGTLRFY